MRKELQGIIYIPNNMKHERMRVREREILYVCVCVCVEREREREREREESLFSMYLDTEMPFDCIKLQRNAC